MAALAAPVGPLLSLNPQEDAKFQKKVAQARRRATKVSGQRGPNLERRRLARPGPSAQRVSAAPRLCLSRVTLEAPTPGDSDPRRPRPQETPTPGDRGFPERTEK